MITDGQGLPLAIELTAANVADTKTLEPMLDAVQPIARPKGRPRKRPHKAHADKGYDSARNRAACRRRGIIPRIARRGIESSEKMGQYRWKVERFFAWLHRYRRLLSRWERRGDIHLGFMELACSSATYPAASRADRPCRARKTTKIGYGLVRFHDANRLNCYAY